MYKLSNYPTTVTKSTCVNYDHSHTQSLNLSLIEYTLESQRIVKNENVNKKGICLL